MNGLAKVAWSPWHINRANNTGEKLFEQNRNQNRISPEEIEKALDYLRNKYKNNELIYIPKDEHGFYRKTYMSENDDLKTFREVHAPDDRFTFLHELGHAADDFSDPVRYSRADGAPYRQERSTAISGKLGIAGGLIGQSVASVSGHEEDSTLTGAATGLLGGSVGVGMGLAASRRINQAEDRANQFVEDYLAREYQDRDRAKREIKKSHLVPNRKTYTRNLQSRLLLNLLAGTAGAGLGTGAGLGLSKGIDSLLEKNKEE